MPSQDQITSYGQNSQGNNYDTRVDSSGNTGYHYSNNNGSYYYSNTNGSTYYNSGNGHSQYTSPSVDKSTNTSQK
ncbi:uncharacterized protein I206_103623 [Kwoniella pini CBS 10737]|uniref:Uncharacterized protein n=1 Tax=Kwoniella pini CBS 10737 TaxID=1296096 RepID=A0AAJ8L6D3_9TREE